MRTTLALENIGRLVEGRHENPFELLGPHEVIEGGRRATAVRAFFAAFETSLGSRRITCEARSRDRSSGGPRDCRPAYAPHSPCGAF